MHHGHVRTVSAVCDALDARRVIWLPVGEPPHRPLPTAAAHHRVAMLELALKDEPRFVLDLREINRRGPSYSVLTLNELHAEKPDADLCLILGMDAALSLPTWHRWQDILTLASIVVMQRPGWLLPDPLPQWWSDRQVDLDADGVPAGSGWIGSVKVPALDISSAGIRADLAKGSSIDAKVPLAIADYIREHRPYG